MQIKDIAKQANVSPATVSRVLHNSGYVSKEKRELVQKVLDELNYVPNKIARGLKNQSTGMIGHILPSPYPNPYMARISRGVDEEAYSRGTQILTLYSYSDEKREWEFIQELKSRMVDGIIFTSPVSRENVKKAIGLGIPVVMVERSMNLQDVDRILIDYVPASYNATRKILDAGHKDIGYIGKQTSASYVESQRHEGYLQAMKDAGIEPKDQWIKFAKDYDPMSGYHLMRELLDGEHMPTAVFIASDMFAVGALQLLYERKLRVPDDISIVGFDNTYADKLSPPLSTVSIPIEEMGRASVQIIIDRCKNVDAAFKTLTMNATFVDRGTVKRIGI
ncbi:LacI family DNA-binding transcriptional regulator [Cohnella sp. REN36]|uniref:LacI family DNA-binding transcriptional regulator n=1 Tax=Cohnella sp. REN36 TaxID=2887347 RepID=UPI001D14341F|nr:LacI family DNA-binding transcriptional regulator [Cohnella sp. REN36]MCC3372318.1 LacI family transcriptional regulator [Cohnella sp. REN36]